MFKKRASFYIKTLIAYGIVLTLLYCSSMQYKDVYNDVDRGSAVVENCTLGVQGKVELENQQTSYAYARMDGLLKQFKTVSAEYNNFCLKDFAQNYDNMVDGVKIIDRVRLLPQKFDKLIGELRQEHDALVGYIVFLRSQPEEEPRENLCLKERCLPTKSDSERLLRQMKQTKMAKQWRWAATRAMNIADQMKRATERLIREAELRNEAAKGRAINAAKAAEKSVANQQ